MKDLARWVLPLALAALSLTAPARAEEEASPVASTEAAEVRLKNGERVRGTLVEVAPGQRVIVIVAGQQSEIPWDQIAEVVDGKKAAPSVAAPARPDTPSRGKPFVHVESSYPHLELTRIEGQIGSGFNTENHYADNHIQKYVCRAPCDRVVDGSDGHRFTFTAPGMMPSPHFRLDEFDGHVTARVHGASTTRFMSGVVLLGLGTFSVLGGGMFALMSTLGDSEGPREPDELDPVALQRASLVAAAVGAGLVVGGIVLVSGGTTRVELVKAKGPRTGVYLEGGALRF
jgi:hypothetical protein